MYHVEKYNGYKEPGWEEWYIVADDVTIEHIDDACAALFCNSGISEFVQFQSMILKFQSVI